MRILIPLDGSTDAERVVSFAQTLLAHAKEPVTLVLLRVVPALVPNQMNASIPASLAVTPHTFGEEYLEVCYDYLCAVQPRFEAPQVTVELSVVEGAPSATICAYAHTHRIDLILMATHGRSGFSEALMGSVAHAVTRDAHLPTLLIRTGGEPMTVASPPAALNILVPIDGTPMAMTALFPALQMAQTFGGTIQLIHVLSPLVESTEDEQKRQQQAQNYMSAMMAHATQRQIHVTAQVVWGDVAEHIMQAVAQQHVDLIAIATHERSGMQRLFAGSVTETIMHHVHMPMMVLHPSEEQVTAEHFPMLSPAVKAQ